MRLRPHPPCLGPPTPAPGQARRPREESLLKDHGAWGGRGCLRPQAGTPRPGLSPPRPPPPSVTGRTWGAPAPPLAFAEEPKEQGVGDQGWGPLQKAVGRGSLWGCSAAQNLANWGPCSPLHLRVRPGGPQAPGPAGTRRIFRQDSAHGTERWLQEEGRHGREGGRSPEDTEEPGTHVYPGNKSCARGFSSKTCINDPVRRALRPWFAEETEAPCSGAAER